MNFNANLEQIRQKKKELQILMEQSLIPTFQELFDLVPELKELNWKQYVPYFNDGDQCVFSIRDLNYIPHYTDHLLEPDYAENGFGLPTSYYTWLSTSVVPRYYKLEEFEQYKKFHDLIGTERLNQINDIIGNFEKWFFEITDILEQIYGSHASVTITNDDGSIFIDVEEYENHD